MTLEERQSKNPSISILVCVILYLDESLHSLYPDSSSYYRHVSNIRIDSSFSIENNLQYQRSIHFTILATCS